MNQNRRFFLQKLLRFTIGAAAAPAIVPAVAKIIQPPLGSWQLGPYWLETTRQVEYYTDDYLKALEEVFRARGDTWRQMDIMTDRFTAGLIRNAFFAHYQTKVTHP